ncbi:MAG: CDP-alcohol phosphatidyltransferase family protein [Myxococcota bacterium]
MSEPANRPSRARSLVLAWGVHFFTASGAVVGALALLAISAGELDNAALLMLFALFIDAVDGSLARAVGVSEVLPDVDGRRLDDIVDFLNFVIVPVVFMASVGSLPGWGWVAAPILASAYGFSQASAKTEDDFFLGWPSYWNVVALYCWLLDLSTTTGAFWLVVCSIGIFLPFKYVYPSKMKRPIFKHTLTAGGFVWAGLLGFTILAPDLGTRLHLVEISFAYLVYYMALSIWLGNWKRGWG